MLLRPATVICASLIGILLHSVMAGSNVALPTSFVVASACGLILGVVSYAMAVRRIGLEICYDRLNLGYCPCCGYLLHAINKHDTLQVVCPECGSFWRHVAPKSCS